MLEKLGRVFLFGIAYAVMLAGMGVGIWALFRIGGTLRELSRSPAERKKREETRRHPFREMSLRAKAAWLICCLEQALWASGLDAEQDEPGSWVPILKLLWEVDELPQAQVLTGWMDSVEAILPSTVLSCASAPEEPKALPAEEQRRFAAAYGLYTQAGYRMAYLAPLLELIYCLIRDFWGDPAASPEDSLAPLSEAQELLECYGIPLPPQDAVDFLGKQKAAGPGEAFVGRQCSSLVGW